MEISQNEAQYKWLEAAKLYQQTLLSINDSAVISDFWEKIGFCYDLASRQATNLAKFKELRQLSIEAYRNAAESIKKDGSIESKGKSLAYLAASEYVSSWLASNPSDKEEILNRCQTFGKEALDNLNKIRDGLEFAKICSTLCFTLYDHLQISPTCDEKRRLAQESINYANKAIPIFSKFKEKNLQIILLSMAGIVSWYFAAIVDDEEERRSLAEQSLRYSKEAMMLSKEAASSYSKAMSRWTLTLSTLFFSGDIIESLRYAEEMLEQASIIGDNYFKGIAYNLQATVMNWMVEKEQDPMKKKEKLEETINSATEAIQYLLLVCQNSDIADTYCLTSESYVSLAKQAAVAVQEKLEFSKKAIEAGKKALDHANRSGSSDGVGSALHALSKAFHYYASLEPLKDERLELLNYALGYRKKYINIIRGCFASNFWTLGVGLIYASLIEADLAELKIQEKAKANLLNDAVDDMENGLTYCKKWTNVQVVPHYTAVVARFGDTFGELLNDRYILKGNSEDLTKANIVYSEAADNFQRADLPNRAAESYWKIARNQDILGNYEQAADNFGEASVGYEAAAKKVESLSDFYLDYATYMKAWREIEYAKLAHSNENYWRAMRVYAKSSKLLRQSKLWNYLSLNFYAWSLLEQAEDLSRKENCLGSIEAFTKAIRSLTESKCILTKKLDDLSKADEKLLVTRLIQASELREEYCHGRIAIEEAKMLDKKGNYLASSGRYKAAVVIFQKISQADSGEIGKEAKLLSNLCQAWQKMTAAEAKGSSALYGEAAELFKLANEYTNTEAASLLVLAHSSFCRALKAGTEFETTWNMDTLAETKKHIDSAANYYLRAGFVTASEYAKATERLFDAYVYMNNAKNTSDPEKETRYYLMAEKVLRISAESFTKAKYLEKTSHVQKLLEKVKEERELAMSLTEVFHAPTITSTMSSFTAIGPNEEKAVGLDRFKHANIQAKLVQSKKEAKVGDDVNVEIHITNIGREAILATELENLVPLGFQFVSGPEGCSFEDSNLILKLNRLDPMETSEITVVIRPLKKGTFEINPHIIYVDETGNRMLNNPELMVLNVLETILAGRVSTGNEDLDNLMLGGLPENCAVVLSSPFSDEREFLIRKFLETGVKNNQITFYITVEPRNSQDLAEEFQSSFYLFVCNPRADTIIENSSNVFKFNGVSNLTDIDVTLVKSFRLLPEERNKPRRACLEILSDVLLQHHAVITRKWLSGLLADFKLQGFTTLAIINPYMHPQEEVQAILGLFEGEIEIRESQAAKGNEKVLRIRRLCNQRYLENELILVKEKLTL